MARAWDCKPCGSRNSPDDPKFNAHECMHCGAKKASPKVAFLVAIGIGGALLVFIVALVVNKSLTLPKKEFIAAFTEYYQDKLITPEEKQRLDQIAGRYRVPVEKRQAWEEEIKKVNVGVGPPPPPPPSPQPPPGPSLDSRQHLQQGLIYVSLARQNPGKVYENYDNAILEFTRAIEIEQNSCYAAAYGNRGVAYMQQKKFNKALDDLTKAIECDPQDKMAHYNLAALYSLQNQRDRALDALDKALSLGFNEPGVLRSDADLRNLRQDREFQKLLEKHKIFLR